MPGHWDHGFLCMGDSRRCERGHGKYSGSSSVFPFGGREEPGEQIEKEKGDGRRGMGNRTRKKKQAAAVTVIVLLLLIVSGMLAYRKIPSRRESMTWARSLKASDVSKIEMIVMPSAEDERYRSFEEEEFDDVVSLINKSTGRYTEEPEPLAGMSRTLYITMKDGTEHVVSYSRYLVIDGDSYADHFHGYSEDGESLGKGKELIPDGFDEYEY